MKPTKKYRLILIIFIITIVCEAGLYYLITVINDDVYNDYHADKTKELKIKIDAIFNAYGLAGNAIFNEAINNGRVLALYSKAYTSDSAGRDRIRDSLYKLLLPTYDHLKAIGLKQLHFHLPDNRSFLRFHRPEKYGDDLTDIRYSVKMANETLKPMQGFEEGRIYNGFRFVFPLFYKKEHIGTVETSFSFGGIKAQLALQDVPNSSFLIKKDVVTGKVFKDELDSYTACPITDEYLCEKKYALIIDSTNKFIDKMNVLIEEEKHNQLHEGRDFSVSYNIDDYFYTASIVSIKNVQNKHVAYVIAYYRDDTLMSIYGRNRITMILGLILLPVLLIFMGLYIYKNLSTAELNKQLGESEKNLKVTNRELQKIVAEKDKFFSIIAHDLKGPVTSMKLMTKTIMEDYKVFSPEDLEEIFEEFYLQTDNTLNLLLTLLDWSRSQRGV